MWLIWQKAIATEVIAKVGAHIGSRYYIGYIPRDKEYPYIYTPVDFTSQMKHVMGGNPIDVFDWQFTIWSDMNNGGAMKVLEIFTDLYNGLGNNLFTVTGYKHIMMLSQFQTTVQQDSKDPNLFHQILLYRVQLQKEA